MSHSRQTEHYALPLYNGTDIINPLTDFNNENERIDEILYDISERVVSAEESAQHSAEVVTEYDERVTAAERAASNASVTANNAINMIAEPFNPLKEGGYKVGDIVVYNDHLFTFINNHTGAWDASDVKEQAIGDALEDNIDAAIAAIDAELAEAMTQIDNQMVRVPQTQAMIAPPFDADKDGGYNEGDIVTYADKLYVFNQHHDGIWTGDDVDKTTVSEWLIRIITESEG